MVKTAIGLLDNFKDFLEKLGEIEPDRYELWYTSAEVALVPTVTSKNVHTYIAKYAKVDELNEALKKFTGRKLKMTTIFYDKW